MPDRTAVGYPHCPAASFPDPFPFEDVPDGVPQDPPVQPEGQVPGIIPVVKRFAVDGQFVSSFYLGEAGDARPYPVCLPLRAQIQ